MKAYFATHYDFIITLLTLIFAVVSFIVEKIPAYLTALIAMAVLLVFGVINTHQALSVFSNSAPITIAAMFIISAALKSTGILDQVGDIVINLAQKHYYLTLMAFFSLVLVFSAFMNNTPIVVVLTPVVMMLAQKLNKSPSKLLIPLSYVAIMGGTCTLIGTSTNLLVNGLVISAHLPSFDIFDITLPGLAMAAVGGLFLLTVGHRLLPERAILLGETFEKQESGKHFIAKAMVPPDSEFIGKTLDEIQFPLEHDLFIVDIVRSNQHLSEQQYAKLRHPHTAQTELEALNALLRQVPLKAYDQLVIRSKKKELVDLHRIEGITLGTHPGIRELREAEETVIIEGIVGPHSRLINSTIHASWIRRLYNCHIWAVHRQGKTLRGNLADLKLRFGDVLLIEGTAEDIEEFFRQGDISNLTASKKERFKKRGIIALITIALVVLLSALNIMPIAGLALIGAVVVIMSQCVSPKEAYENIDWQILMLIFGMLTLSIAMQKTGMDKVLVRYAVDFSKQFGAHGMLAAVYIVTSLLTEIMTNSAAAVLITPLIIGLTANLGLDPRPFIVAIMFAASASFATPLGYQTNTYVYNAGNYQFKDFLKVGVPMNILNFLTAMVVIPLFWPLK